jgi:hypothetical protein
MVKPTIPRTEPTYQELRLKAIEIAAELEILDKADALLVLRYAKLLTTDYIGEEPTGRATIGIAVAGISGAIVGSVLTLGLLHIL